MATGGEHLWVLFLVTCLLEDVLWALCHPYTSTVGIKTEQAFQMQNRLLMRNLSVRFVTEKGCLQGSLPSSFRHTKPKWMPRLLKSLVESKFLQNPCWLCSLIASVCCVDHAKVNKLISHVAQKPTLLHMAQGEKCPWVIIASRFSFSISFFKGKNNTGEPDSATGS